MHTKSSTRLSERMSAIRAQMMSMDPLLVLILSQEAIIKRNSIQVEQRLEERITLIPGYKVTPKTGLIQLLRFGWNNVEDWGAWTEGARSVIVFKLPKWLVLPVRLELYVTPFLGNINLQAASFYIRDRMIKILHFSDERSFKVDLVIEEQDRSGDFCVDLTILVRTPMIPSEVGRGEDHRKLGLALNHIELVLQ